MINEMSKCERCGKLAVQGDVVTISMQEFEALKRDAAMGGSRRRISNYRAVSRSAIARNLEMADFIIESLATKTITEVAVSVAEKFGASAPSRSSIHRFVAAVKNPV